MCKIKSSIVFKTYNQQQVLLLPPSLDELIGPTQLVRVVNEVVEQMDITDLANLYEGGGTTAYHPRMLLKVLLYGYCTKVYTGRRIAKALRQDIHFMWLSAMSVPDFRTINHFRSSRAAGAIESLFKEMLGFLATHEYIKLEDYFCDGTTIRADTNKHKMVWRKNSERYKAAVEQGCLELFAQIDELNSNEDKEYGKKDLGETGASSPVTAQDIKDHVEKLDACIKTAAGKAAAQKAKSLKKKLEAASGRLDAYDNQIATAGTRSGYNKTDTDASAMMMKSKAEVLPAYNILAGCEGQFITGVSAHQNTNDGACFAAHMEQIKEQRPAPPTKVVADSIFGTEHNYALLEEEKIGNYMKFPSFHGEQTKKHKGNKFHKDNFSYDAKADTYGCPAGKSLVVLRSYGQENEKTGFVSALKEYGCDSCGGCPFYDSCCKSTTGAGRRITINERLEKYKQRARENLNSKEGIALGIQRGIEIESCFGDIKHNMSFRRFHLRGLRKVKTEFSLVAMAHNIRKVHLKREKAAA